MISMQLAARQNISEEAVAEIIHRHEVREGIVLAMENTNDTTLLKRFFKKWSDNEYALQKLWGFEEDSDFHKWWYVPKCTCPKMDNDDNYPLGYYVTDTGCPVHGGVE